MSGVWCPGPGTHRIRRSAERTGWPVERVGSGWQASTGTRYRAIVCALAGGRTVTLTTTLNTASGRYTSGKTHRMNRSVHNSPGSDADTGTDAPLKRCVVEELERYFQVLEGEAPCDLYKMVIGETECALLQYVLERTGGNQSRAAQLLGLNRGTLRKKLQQHGIAS